MSNLNAKYEELKAHEEGDGMSREVTNIERPPLTAWMVDAKPGAGFIVRELHLVEIIEKHQRHVVKNTIYSAHKVTYGAAYSFHGDGARLVYLEEHTLFKGRDGALLEKKRLDVEWMMGSNIGEPIGHHPLPGESINSVVARAVKGGEG